ncbi:MAG: glycosyltransferase [Bacteroidota bacterium]
MTPARVRDDGPVLVFDPNHGGHRHEFIAWIANAWIRESIQRPLAIAAPDDTIHRSMSLRARNPNAFTIHISTDPGLGDASPRRQLATLEHLSATLGAHHALAMDLEHLLHPGALTSRWSLQTLLSGITFRPTVHYSALGSPPDTIWDYAKRRGKALISGHALRWHHVHTVFCLDETAVPALARLAPPTRVVGLPDPVPPRPDGALSPTHARAWAGVEPERHLALLAGRLDARKNAVRVLEAARMLPEDAAKRLAVLLAGPVPKANRRQLDAAIQRVREQTPVAVHLIDGFVPDRHLTGLVDGADTVVLCYDRHVGSSGFLMRAADAGVPVLSQSFGLVGHLTRTHQLGLTVETMTPETIAEGLNQRITQPTLGYDAARAAAFVAGHSPEAFGRTIISHLV